MDLVAVDLVSSKTRIDNFGSRVRFPRRWTDTLTGMQGVPPLFIVNVQLPSECIFSVFREVTDGPGYSLVFYFLMTDDTLTLLNNAHEVPLPGPLNLLVSYLKEGPESDASPRSNWRGRFKTMVHCRDIETFRLPSFITAYNAKPVLIRQTGTLLRGDNYVELDINVHRFGSAPKQALTILKERFEAMDMCVGFCIESREEGEMPETVFGCAAVHRPRYALAPVWDN